MAIGNVTPDSFYAPSRLANTDQVLAWASEALAQGADILDIGGCSTRPGYTAVDEEEEWTRVFPALTCIKSAFPTVPLSIDTFRPEIARRALAAMGSIIINDISGGCQEMYDIVRQYHATYIWTLRGELSLPSQHPEMNDIDLILDPGFGFCGGVEQDYACLRRIEELKEYGRPILAGISRKSMIWKPLGLMPDKCLCPTQALQLYALEHGATILRTHDVAATAQTITLYNQLFI